MFQGFFCDLIIYCYILLDENICTCQEISKANHEMENDVAQN